MQTQKSATNENGVKKSGTKKIERSNKRVAVGYRRAIHSRQVHTRGKNNWRTTQKQRTLGRRSTRTKTLEQHYQLRARKTPK